MKPHRMFVASVAWLAAAAASGQTASPPSRGQLLYDTHCLACHSAQMHWREGRVVRDWASLVAQVSAWQDRERLQWPADDILQVARHLNATIYRLPQPQPPQGRGEAGPRHSAAAGQPRTAATGWPKLAM
jgi:hypothetical protein